jgi:hypothetical protein
MCMRIVLPVLPLLAACTPAADPTGEQGTAPAPAAPAATVVTLVAPPAAAPTTSVPISAAPASAHVEASGCRFRGVTDDRFDLSYDSANTAATFASVRTPNTVALALGENGSPASIRVDVFGFTLDAQVPPHGIPLHAKAPLALGGVYDPATYLPLHWQTTPFFGVEARPNDDGPAFTVSAMTPTRCDDIGLSRADFKPRPRPAGKSSTRETTQPTRLSVTPGGVPIALIPAHQEVEVFAQQQAFSQVVFFHDGVWFGWVPSAALTRAKPVFGGLMGHGTGTGNGREQFSGHRCPAEIPLYVRAVGEPVPLRQVGVVRPDVHVAFATQPADGYRRLRAEQRRNSDELGSLELASGFELVVDAAAAETCVPSK